MARVSAGLLRAGVADPPPRLPALGATARGGRLGGRGAGQDPRGSFGPASAQSQPAAKSHPSQCWRCKANQAGRAKAASPSPAASAFFFRQHQRVYVATGTRKLWPLTEPRPPSLPGATSWHLKLCVAKHLINCPAVSPCCLLPSLPFLALSGSFPVPSTCNTSPQSCKKLQPSARKLPQLPCMPHAQWWEALAWLGCPMHPLLPSQRPWPSLPTRISPAFASRLAETRVASHLCRRAFLLGLPRRGVALLEGPFLL